MPTVKVYTRTTCAPCRTLKHWLKSKGVPYEEINVDEDPALMDLVIKQTGIQQVPMTQVGEDRFISGLNIALLANLLML